MWLNELGRRWMGQAPRQLRRRSHLSRGQKRLTLEALEDRTLPAPISTTGDLIAAIDMANSSGTPTTITLQMDTIFNFMSPDIATNGYDALPIITGNITIVGNGDDTLVRTAPPTTAFRLFDVASGGSLTLQNVTLKGGLVQGPGSGAQGGPVFGSGTLYPAQGGAIFSSGTLKLNGVTVESNTALGSSGVDGVGGGGRGAGQSGAAAYGGGLYVAGGSVSLTNSILSSNNAKGGNGGNGHAEGTSYNASGGNGGNGGNATGGGLYVAGGSVSLSNDTFSGNQAIGGNGGNGGNAEIPGQAGDGGGAAGGGVNLSGASILMLKNDSFLENNADGGNGGNGGNAILVQFSGGEINGDNDGSGGGAGGAALGGGLNVVTPDSVTVSDDTFSENTATGGLGGNGGKGSNGYQAYNSVPPVNINGQPGGNGGNGGDAAGGGVYVSAMGNINLVNDTLAGNQIEGGWGGVGGDGGNNTTNIFGGAAGGNGGDGGDSGSGTGGGLFVNQGTVTLINDTIACNIAVGGVGGNGGDAEGGGNGGAGGEGGAGEGGGFAVPASNVAYGLANTLIAENLAAGNPGGLHGGGGNDRGDGSDGIASGFDVSGAVISSDHDLIGNTDGSSGFGNTGSGDLLNMPPYLGPLQNNGGPTDTMAELTGSPTIGAGDPKAPGLPGTDQRGAARTVVVNGKQTVDIGAYEFGATPPATPALSISGSGGSSTTPGGPITYTFTVTNTSSTDQSNVDVADSLPANTTLVAWTAASGWSSSAPPAGSSSGTVSAAIASLAANSSATFTLVVQVAPGTPVGTVISNAASFGPFAEAANSGTNSASVNTTVLYAPTLQVTDGGTYNGNPYPATATAVGIDGTTPVAGSFSYAYYAGTSASGTPLNYVPVNAGTYTVVATFTSNDPNYSSGGTSQTTFTIIPAPISYTIGNDTQAYGYPANLAADLPASFSTGINGETLDIAYSSSGDTSTALPGSYAITGVVSNGTGLASNYNVTLTDGTLTVLGSGVTPVGSTLWIVGGATSNDNVQVSPIGSSTTGSTGVQVQATLNRVSTSKDYSQSFAALNIFLYGGNDSVQLASSLTLNATVSAGNGNDNVQAGNGTNTITTGNGNDNVQLGNGNNTITTGNGNDNVQVGNGNNVVVTGNGNDSIQAGNGDNLIAAGLGQHTVQVGNGSNILIDGSVQLTQSGDSLRQVLDDWILYGNQAANVASIRSRLSVTYNTQYANTLHAGSGLDWFWFTDTQDKQNAKPTDLRN